jgi:hypothetical protein
MSKKDKDSLPFMTLKVLMNVRLPSHDLGDAPWLLVEVTTFDGPGGYDTYYAILSPKEYAMADETGRIPKLKLLETMKDVLRWIVENDATVD